MRTVEENIVLLISEGKKIFIELPVLTSVYPLYCLTVRVKYLVSRKTGKRAILQDPGVLGK